MKNLSHQTLAKETACFFGESSELLERKCLVDDSYWNDLESSWFADHCRCQHVPAAAVWCCVWGLYNLLHVYLYLQYIHVYIYIFNMTGIMYQLYDMCVLLMLFSVCFGLTMFGEPWLRPPALWNQLRATRPGPAARKIIMKPMIFTLSMAFGRKKKHNPNNLTRKHKENHYNWQFQLISIGGIEKKHNICRFRNNWGQGPEFATVTPCPCKAEWLGSVPGILVDIFFPATNPGVGDPQFWCWKVRESSQKCPKSFSFFGGGK